MNSRARPGEDLFAPLLDHITGQLDAIAEAPGSGATENEGADANGANDVAEDDGAVLRRLRSAVGRLLPRPVLAVSRHSALDRWLDHAVELASSPTASLAQSIQGCAPFLHWNLAYPDEKATPLMKRFWPNYTYCALAVPDGSVPPPGPFQSEEMALFLVLQGAGVVYPRHQHPATEVYGVVAGTGRWLRGDEGYTARPPGEIFVHAPNVPHATTTTGEPTLSWAAWLGDIGTRAVMSGGGCRS